MDPRFISLFNTFEIQFPSSDNLRTIYSSILSSHVGKLSHEIQDAAGDLTDVTLDLYNYILEKLPPTPSRFHYIFNLRDLSRIYEGILCSTADKFKTQGDFIRLWRNEALRILHDRLISEEDKTVVIEKMNELVLEKYELSQEQILRDPILFGDYLNASEELGLDENGNEKPKTLRLSRRQVLRRRQTRVRLDSRAVQLGTQDDEPRLLRGRARTSHPHPPHHPSRSGQRSARRRGRLW